MTDNAQLAIEVYRGALVIRQAGQVVRRFDRDQTGTVTVNLADHPDADTPDSEPWTKFEPAQSYRDGRPVDLDAGVEVWKNNLYTVQARRHPDGTAYLSIRANNRHWRHDWRHLQRIKNELLGEDVEAAELYPATDRLVDDANQFHLWALPAGHRFPFGFSQASPAPDEPDQVPNGAHRQRPTTSPASCRNAP